MRSSKERYWQLLPTIDTCGYKIEGECHSVEVVLELWKEYLHCNFETLSNCSPRRTFYICQRFLPITWHCHNNWIVTRRLTQILFFFHRILRYSDFSRKWWNPRWRIQDGGFMSYEVIRFHANNNLKKSHLAEQAGRYIFNAKRFWYVSLQRKTRGGFYPPPTLYKGGGMSLLVRPLQKLLMLIWRL